MSDRSPVQRFIAELRRRHVPQTVAIYLVAAWAAIEFTDVVVPNLNGPQWVITAVIVAAGVGLPVVLVLAWIFDWGPDGLHRTPGGPEPEPGLAARAEPHSTTPWMIALAVLVVGIGSALAVAALLAGGGAGGAGGDDGDRGAPAVPGVPGHPEDPHRLVGPTGVPDMDSLTSRIMRDLEQVEGLRDLSRLEDLGDLMRPGGLGDMGPAAAGELREALARAAGEAGVGVFLQEPAEWRVGRSDRVTLAEGDTLVVRGLALDTAGVASVSLDGVTIAESEDPRPSLRFASRVIGVGSSGLRQVRFRVRTADGREVLREFPVEQTPGGSR